jgi:ABC-2 type transport system permease protein
MSSSSESAPAPLFDAPAATASVIRSTRPLYWSVRRELWEHRSVFVAPLIAAGVVVLGLLISAIRLGHHLSEMPHLDPARHGGALALPFDFAAIPVMVTALIVAVFYCLGALHNERRDRSILFWKSLPVSDLTAVLAKTIIPMVVIPLVAMVIICALHLFMLLIGTATLLAHGVDPTPFWTEVPWLGVEVTLLYLLVTVSLWYAPIYGWLLLVSAFAKRAPFLWAVLPPLALCLLERIAFDTSNLWSLLSYRLHGGFSEAFDVSDVPTHHAMWRLPRIDVAQYLSTPGLWVGLVFAAAFLAAAIWMRRYREPT